MTISDSVTSLNDMKTRSDQNYDSSLNIYIIKERSNGQRFRRSKKNIGLTEEDIVYLKHNTRYDEEEIREWYR